MACKFNSGIGGNTCDRCRRLLCSGFFPKPYYGYSTSGPEHHYMIPKSRRAYTGAVEIDDDGTAHAVENTLLHEREYCEECATVILIERDVKMVTAKELYNL